MLFGTAHLAFTTAIGWLALFETGIPLPIALHCTWTLGAGQPGAKTNYQQKNLGMPFHDLPPSQIVIKLIARTSTTRR